MKAIILAAGRGTRISREINGKPKCTVHLDDQTALIQYTVDLLRSKGIRDVSLVLGYEQGAIREVLGARDVRYYFNPFFDVTNSIASLWFAREVFAQEPDDCLIMNGDVYLSAPALDSILAEKKSPVMFYDTTRIEEADYKFGCEGDLLVRYGKELTPAQTSGEYVGCASFSRAYAPHFVAQLGALIEKQSHGLWWENVLYTLSQDQKIFVKDLAGLFWGEVDFIEDYNRIKAYHQGR